MQSIHRFIGGIVLFGLALCLVALPQHAASSSSREAWAAAGGSQSSSSEPVPTFHSEAPKGPLPATMDPGQFTDPVAQNAYALAARIKKTLYQQPCYCHCDQSQGHGSLLDCFVSKHGAGCGTCMREDFYTYEQLHKGKTAAQIREGIERGDWQSVDAKKYEKPLPAATH
jgi:hypothetical protein